MWSDGNGLESPSISLASSRASEEAPQQGAAKQNEAKMLGRQLPWLARLGRVVMHSCFFPDWSSEHMCFLCPWPSLVKNDVWATFIREPLLTGVYQGSFFLKSLLYLFGCYCSSSPGEIPCYIYWGSVLETNLFRYLYRKFLSSENQVLTMLLEGLDEQEWLPVCRRTEWLKEILPLPQLGRWGVRVCHWNTASRDKQFTSGAPFDIPEVQMKH